MSKKFRNHGSLFAVLLFLTIYLYGGNADATACSIKNELGSATYGVTIPEAGEYKLWARLRPDGNSANKIFIEIDGNNCLIAGDDVNLAAKTWKWVDYGGSKSKKPLLHTFESAGNHSIKVSSNEPGVGVDRLLLLTASDKCVPSNKREGDSQPGDNCKTGAVAVPINATEENSNVDNSDSAVSKSSANKWLIVLSIMATLTVSGVAGWYKLRRFRANKADNSEKTVILPK